MTKFITSINGAFSFNFKTKNYSYIYEDEVEWITKGRTDYFGKVFIYDGIIYRALDKIGMLRYNQIKDSRILQKLQKLDLIPEVFETNLRMHGFELILKVENSLFRPRIHTQIPEVIRNAAIKWIHIYQVLLLNHMSIADINFNNFAFFHGNPKWVDIGSISPHQSQAEHINGFVTRIYFPLLLRSEQPGMDPYVRNMFETGNQAIFIDDAIKLNLSIPEISKTSPFKAAKIFMKSLEEMTFPQLTGDWSNYLEPSVLEKNINTKYDKGHPDGRLTLFESLLDHVQPSRALDLGCNIGRFATLIARRNVPCLAIDYDQASLTILHHFAERHKLPITTAFADVSKLNIDYDVDLVSAMGLTHHLSLGQFLSWQFIAQILAAPTRYALITDFMPWGTGKEPPEPGSYLAEEYKLNHFIVALRDHFRQVRSIQYIQGNEQAPRIMIVCEERI